MLYVFYKKKEKKFIYLDTAFHFLKQKSCLGTTFLLLKQKSCILLYFWNGKTVAYVCPLYPVTDQPTYRNSTRQ